MTPLKEFLEEKNAKIVVNLETDTFKVITTISDKIWHTLPDGSKRFIVERDKGGFSCIDLQDGEYYNRNFLRTREGDLVYAKQGNEIITRKKTIEKIKEGLAIKFLKLPY